MSAPHIHIVEDSPSLALGYAAQLEAAGYVVTLSENLADARRVLRGGTVNAVLLDLQLPDGDGLDLLAEGVIGNAAVIVVTADGSLARAITAMRIGAFDFLVKPVAGGRLLATVRSAVDHAAGEAKASSKGATAASRRDDGARGDFHGFVGTSPVMRDIYSLIERVAPSRASVFVTGESGTGKEVTAEAIHAESGRKGAFVAVNCGAIPEALMESELFGHIKGAFTGAIDNRIGAAKAADGGTLFLDEICEMDLKLQVKLLRFLQTGTITRVGSSTAEPVDVRIICATNRDVEREVAAGRFREDLFYRLNVIPIRLPALRERGGDVTRIAGNLVRTIAREERREGMRLTEHALDVLGRHGWPGNVRELQNALRRAIITAPGPDIALADQITQPRPSVISATPVAANAPLSGEPGHVMAEPRTLAEIERAAIQRAIAATGGNICAAAKILDVSPSTIYRKMERWQASQASS